MRAKNILSEFLNFVKKPDDTQIKTFSAKQKISFLFTLLCFEIIFTTVIIFPLIYGIDEISRIRYDKFDYNYTFANSIIYSVIIVSFVEELLFRYILRYRGIKTKIINKSIWIKIFPWLVYTTSFGFGSAHLFNYTNEDIAFYILAPFIVLSQLAGGLVIAFIRVRLSFKWGVFYHWIWNFLFIIAIPFIQLQYSNPYIEETHDYKISVTEKQFFNKDQPQVLEIDSANVKIHEIKLKQFSVQTLLDTLYTKDKYYVDDVLIDMDFTSKSGLTKDQLLRILRKKYDLDSFE